MYNEQLVQVFKPPEENLGGESYLLFYRTGTLSSPQFLLLGDTFSDLRPFISKKNYKISEIHTITNDYLGQWSLHIYIDNILSNSYVIDDISKLLLVDIPLNINSTLSVQIEPTISVKDIYINLKLDYE